MTRGGALRTTRIRLRGLVQGVGYRHFVVRAAERHGVRGWVRNLRDGSVEVAAQGAPDAFIDEVVRGPAWAEVAAVDRWETNEPPVIGFEVRFGG